MKAGKLVALGIAGTRPVSSLPDVPVLASGALQRLDLTAWFGFFVPKETPHDIVELLNVTTQFDRPGMRERVIREVCEIFKGNVFFGEDLMEIPFTSPAAVRLD